MRGLNKPSIDIVEQKDSIQNETIPSDVSTQPQSNPLQVADDNGISFLV
jgi:hypothetical protein